MNKVNISYQAVSYQVSISDYKIYGVIQEVDTTEDEGATLHDHSMITMHKILYLLYCDFTYIYLHCESHMYIHIVYAVSVYMFHSDIVLSNR